MSAHAFLGMFHLDANNDHLFPCLAIRVRTRWHSNTCWVEKKPITKTKTKKWEICLAESRWEKIKFSMKRWSLRKVRRSWGQKHSILWTYFKLHSCLITEEISYLWIPKWIKGKINNFKIQEWRTTGYDRIFKGMLCVEGASSTFKHTSWSTNFWWRLKEIISVRWNF